MNFFKRAKTSIFRSPGKSAILLTLVFMLGTIIAGALAVEGAVVNTEENLRRNMPAVVSVGIDEQQVLEYVRSESEMPTITGFNAELIRSIGELPYVREFNYSIETWLGSFELDMYFPAVEGLPTDFFDDMLNIFDIVGLSSATLIPLEEGVIDLTSGRMLTDTEITTPSATTPALVSNTFAQLNNLAVGSTFTLSNKITQGQDSGLSGSDLWLAENLLAYEHHEFEIVGLFERVEEEATNNESNVVAMARGQSMHNQMYVPNWFAENVESFQNSAQNQGENTADEPTISAIFMLEDPREIDDFRRAATPMLPEFIGIEDLTNTFESISTSMSTLIEIANWILWAAIGATFLILSLLLTLFLRDRRYEMGIYLALGEKKGKVIAQVLLEVLAISVVGISIAVFAGTAISSNISQMMLKNALTTESASVDIGGGTRGAVMMISIPGSTSLENLGFSGAALSVDEMMSAFDVSLNGETILLFYAIGIVAVVVSTLIPIFYLTKLSPKKVLMRQ